MVLGKEVGLPTLVREEPASYQLGGEVMAHQAMTGRGCESMAPGKGTETRTLLLREAAVENLRQCPKG